MPPPGRRRSGAPSLTLLIASILLLFSPTILAQNAVLGLDVGTEYIKAALVKPGIPLEIVLTKDSKRKETAAIAFKTDPKASQADGQLPERLYGGDALSLAPRIPGDVYPNLKHLLGAGQPGRTEAVRSYRARYPALALVKHAENSTLAFKSRNFPETQPAFSVEELLSMELRTIRENAEGMASSRAYNTVITVPPFFSADERRAMETAAELAGLRVIGLVSDGMAVGLNYATSRTFGNVDEGGKPEYHLVYDMGAGSTTATVLKMQGRRVKDAGKFNKTIQEVSTIGLGWDRSLGGDALNDVIVSDMVEKFVESKDAKAANVEASAVKKHGRTMAKLFREAERLRQVLSANTATSAFFEGLYEDIDFRYKLTRPEFEEMAQDFGLRVSQPIKDALDSAGLTVEELTSVILHGGLVRTPFVQSSLESVTGGASKLKSNVNADEAAVFGAAFKAAGLSPSFRVKEIKDNDVAIYPVALHWASNGKERKQQIFVPTSQAGAAKQMPFKMLDDFSFSFSQKLPLVDIDRPVLDVTANNLTASVAKLISDHGCVRENISTVISIRLDPSSGLPEVTKGSVSCESSELEKKGMMDGVKDMFGFGKKDQKPLSDDEAEETIEPLPESTTSTSSSISSSKASSSTTATDRSKTSAPPARKTHTIPLSFSTTKTGLLQPRGETLQRIKDGLAALDKSDKARRLREELFNGLEGFTYRVRDMLTDSTFASVSTSTQRSDLSNLLASTNEWLHTEGSSAGIDTIKSKLQDLRALVDPVQKRREEQSKRPLAVQKLQDVLASASSLKDSVADSVSSAVAAASSSASSASLSAADAAASATESAAEATSSAASVAEEGASSVADAVSEGASSVSEAAATATASKVTTADADPSAIYSSIMAQMSAYANPYEYTSSDLERLTSSLEGAREWLEEKSGLQGKLSESEEPVLVSAEVEERTAGVRKVVEELERKRRVRGTGGGGSSSGKKKAAKTTKARRVKSTATSAQASTTSVADEATETPTIDLSGEEPATETESKAHDEL